MNSKLKYVVSFFVESKNGVTNSQYAYDDYDEAIDYAHKLSLASNITSICFETYVYSHVETSVIKD